jgi:two-component system, cell cycle response regulator
LAGETLATVHTAGLLHDLGKVAVPEAILHKPGRLTDAEYAIVKQHPAIGKRILADMDLLGDVARMIGEHHERYDGGGYPHRIAGEEISIGGRILAVADALDSMLSDRAYSAARPLVHVLAEIDRCAGTQFDPAIVSALHRVIAAKGGEYFGDGASDIFARQVEDEHAQIILFPRVRVG